MLLKYFFAWFGMIVLAVANGALRDFGYKKYAGELPAHQISTVSLLFLLSIYFWILIKYMPIQSESQAWIIGVMWIVLTVGFEFSMGRFISKAPWSKLLHDYNILAGRIWILIPLWTFFAPYIFYKLTRSK